MFTRALIVLLIVANVGVAAWWLLRAPDTAPVAVQLPAGTPRLRLPAEVPPARRPAAIAAPASALASRCLAFGPFADAPALARARAALQPRVVRLQPRSGDAAPRGWRVWIAPLPDRAAAQALAQRIAAAGFADYYVVVDGTEANGIALGRYGGEAAAREHARALQAAGFTAAQAEPLPGPGVQWLDVAAVADFDVAAARAASGAREARPLPCAELH